MREEAIQLGPCFSPRTKGKRIGVGEPRHILFVLPVGGDYYYAVVRGLAFPPTFVVPRATSSRGVIKGPV